MEPASLLFQMQEVQNGEVITGLLIGLLRDHRYHLHLVSISTLVAVIILIMVDIQDRSLLPLTMDTLGPLKDLQ